MLSMLLGIPFFPPLLIDTKNKEFIKSFPLWLLACMCSAITEFSLLHNNLHCSFFSHINEVDSLQ